jgi:hypothetical protein
MRDRSLAIEETRLTGAIIPVPFGIGGACPGKLKDKDWSWIELHRI